MWKSRPSDPTPAPRDLATGLYAFLLFNLNGWERIGELGLVSLPDNTVPELPLARGCDANPCQSQWAAKAAPTGVRGVTRAAGAQSQHPIQLPAGGVELGSPPGGASPHIWGDAESSEMYQVI